MTLVLDNETYPPVKVKTWGVSPLNESVFFGDYVISLGDFCAAAHYVLTNTDLLGSDDPRLKFIEGVKSLQRVTGYNPGNLRLAK